MGGIWSFFYPREDLASRQRHRQQQLIIQEIESIEACVYCYIDSRLKTLLMSYISKSYPWDQSCDILPYFREKSESQSRSCYHCLKMQLKDHFSCQIIDQIFQKKTQKCQCEVLSEESSEISFRPFDDNDSDENMNENSDDGESSDENSDDDSQVEHSSTSSLTDSD